ncbi:MAG TPA: YncE family protein [Jatrophihabitans sp.]|jgi:DNA-binding beta-propeller fold protein YncE|nr:YncE family protein [Jatrophihabitans sp.]
MHRTRSVRNLLGVIVAAVAVAALIAPVGAQAAGTRQVMYVGNNWAGTASVVDAHSYQVLKILNVMPDKAQRLQEIYLNPVKLAFYLAIRAAIGQGHDQYVDDMFSTTDGRLLAVSRPSFADVVGLDIATGRIVWRTPMDGYRADHMAVSPDGTRLLVSDSTTTVVHELDIATGQRLRDFSSGDTPHESNYSPDGSLIYHASIGRIYTPTDPSLFCPLTDPTKGTQIFEVVDNATFAILHRWDLGQKLAEAGYPCMSSAVRPMAIAPDQRYAYLQISFLHGFVEFDMQQERVTRLASLPNLVPTMPKAQYVLNSAHHGLAMNAAGTTLCAAGTMDGYAAIVDRASFNYTTIPVGDTPYWATNGPGGTQCWMSIAGDDKVDVIDYATSTKVAEIAVGDHPQRIRLGTVAADIAAHW